MILVDTSVWIDFFRPVDSPFRKTLHFLLENEEDLCLTEIILTEILQGIKKDKDFRAIKEYLLDFPVYSLKNRDSYIESAQIYRKCRKKGITIRRTVDCLIAQVAIENNLVLFHNDQDFNQIAKVVKNLKTFEIKK
mgnify:CR=1 FL=1